MTDYPRELSLSFLGHLRELYRRLVFCLAFTAVFVAAGFVWGGELYGLLMRTIPAGVIQYNESLFGPFVLRTKIAVYFGIFFSLPVYTQQAYLFIRPALKRPEDSFARALIFLAWALLLMSLAFTSLLLPYFITALLSWTPEGVRNFANVNIYIDTFLAIYLGFSILFQVPLVIYLTIRNGFVSAEYYASHRKWVIVITLALAAIFTPPDVLSQIIVSIPIYALFEAALLLGRLSEKRCSG